MLPFELGATLPEIACIRLLSGPGELPMNATAAAYANMADALVAAAGGSDGSTRSLGDSWRSETSDKAQAAFHRHANWLRQQSSVAGQVAAAAATVAAAYSAARTYAAATLPIIMTNRVAFASLTMTNTMGQNSPAIAVNETVYYLLWLQTTAVMNGYASQVMGAMATIPPPAPPPHIVMPGGMGAPHLGMDGLGDPAGLGKTLTDATNAANSAAEQVANQAVNGAADPVSKAAESLTDPATSPESLAQQAIPDGNQATMSPADTLADPGASGVDGGLAQQGFLGTSPYSATLAGLNGGVGSMSALGMIRGGLGSMSGASTGFRMPSSWPSGPGTAFGAATPPPAGAPFAPPMAPTGATAPVGQLLRRHEDTERGPGRVFVPGMQYEVPTLEQAPAFGVLEYHDEDAIEAVAAESVLLGVLGPDDDAEFRP
ncbi:PPE domain-containing protein [Nocardia altamirensis]|uniref:PPE domain-containing protein n=1 Tax=Nocardia altamirensis TaxID=472158 RepID=UPI00084046DF|nr:PPE domain-containing protein [Nocardia altamirensis]